MCLSLSTLGSCWLHRSPFPGLLLPSGLFSWHVSHHITHSWLSLNQVLFSRPSFRIHFSLTHRRGSLIFWSPTGPFQDKYLPKLPTASSYPWVSAHQCSPLIGSLWADVPLHSPRRLSELTTPRLTIQSVNTISIENTACQPPPQPDSPSPRLPSYHPMSWLPLLVVLPSGDA